MGNKFIRNYIAKRVAGRSDDGIMITLSDPKKIDFQVAMMEDLLMRNGIDPRAITSENQFKGILNLLESIEKANLANNIRSGITGSKSAKIFSPEISLPSANLNEWLSFKKLSSFIKSPKTTFSLFIFGISIPKLNFPGCDEILADKDDIALAISSDKPTTLLALIPAFGTNSKRVTIGPDL